MTQTEPLPVTIVLGDPTLPDVSKPGGRFTDDDLDQVVRMQAALGKLTGYRFDYWNDHRTLLERLRRERPAFVLNFCDTGYRNNATLELHLAAYLEMLAIPFSGSGPVALGLCYDKAFVRAIADAHGIPVPWEKFLGAEDAVEKALGKMAYPAFIKPNRGDGSVGITGQSIVADASEAQDCVDRLRAMLPGTDIIAQEFLAGDEYGIGIIGNPGLGFDALPALEVDYSGLDPSLPRLLDYGSKTDPASPYWSKVKYRAARLSDDQRSDMTAWCERLFGRLGLRDYARFDFRANQSGEIKLMEINPNPAWCHDGKLAHMASLRGEDHSALLKQIIEAASRRTAEQPG